MEKSEAKTSHKFIALQAGQVWNSRREGNMAAKMTAIMSREIIISIIVRALKSDFLQALLIMSTPRYKDNE